MKMRKLTAFAAAAAMLMSCPIPSAQAEDQVFMHDTFESGADSWTGRGAASAAASSDFSCEGSSSLSVTGRTAAWNGAIKELSSDFVAGQSYSFSANVMYTTGGASDTFYMKLEYKNSEGVTSYSEIAAGETVKDAWVQLSNQSYTIPEGATDLKVYVETADSQNSFYLDDFGAGSEGTVFKGTGPSKKLQRGDIDYDGRISVFDIILGRQLLTGEYDNAAALKAADADGNKTYEVNDLVLINEFVQGKISEFPEPPKPDNPWDEYVETASDQYISFYKDAICNMGNTQRLVKKLEAAENGESLTLGYIGGSITEGKNYSNPFTSYVRNTFAKGSFKEVNIGMSGTSSVVGLVRAEKGLVAQNPDIVVIEFSVNDHEDISYKKSFESLIRKFLEMPNEPAVIVLITRSKGGFSSQTQMEAAGKNFDVPVISMNNSMTKAFNSGFLKPDDYYTDEYHPHEKGGQLIADTMAYYLRQAMKTENRSDSYTIPSTSAYGSEYYTCVNMSPNELTNFSAGSFTAGNGYDRNNTLSYSYTFQKNSANNAMTFTTTGKGLILVFKANSSGMGTALVTVNGKTTKVSGNKQYTWGGPDAEVAYYQETAGEMNVSIKMENAGTDFTIWGLGVIK
ncbi:MAG: carbohydrate binding domain-containing protein [Ruminococcus sp.]|nr:carbohydrate binding domain-containing protein [Ruminococcus sp.]